MALQKCWFEEKKNFEFRNFSPPKWAKTWFSGTLMSGSQKGSAPRFLTKIFCRVKPKDPRINIFKIWNTVFPYRQINPFHVFSFWSRIWVLCRTKIWTCFGCVAYFYDTRYPLDEYKVIWDFTDMPLDHPWWSQWQVPQGLVYIW